MEWSLGWKVGLIMFRILTRQHKEPTVQICSALRNLRRTSRSYASVQSLEKVIKKEGEVGVKAHPKKNNVKLDVDNATKRVLIDATEFGIDKVSVPYVWLRDSCQRSKYSVDASTKQRLFETSDIRDDLEIKRIELVETNSSRDNTTTEDRHRQKHSEEDEEPALIVEWSKEPLESKSPNESTSNSRKSIIPLSTLQRYLNGSNWLSWTRKSDMEPRTWHRNQLSERAFLPSLCCLIL